MIVIIIPCNFFYISARKHYDIHDVDNNNKNYCYDDSYDDNEYYNNEDFKNLVKL